MNILELFLQELFPRNCYFCGKAGKYICLKCRKTKFVVNWEQRCHVCGGVCRSGFVHVECKMQTYLDGLIFVTLYDEKVKYLIQDVKYKFYFDILFELGDIMAKFFNLYKFNNEVTITAVPLHSKKYKYRGFNQAEILAKKIAKRNNTKYEKLISKSKFTQAQATLDKVGRAGNLKDAFHLSFEAVIPKTVIIVDDVYTTGATLNECAKLLKAKGVEQIYGYVFAKSRL